jgi:phosphoglycolate phosphatase-like HAD superfamily hydrolase
MTKGAETYGFKLSNFVNTLEKYLGKKVDKIIYNSKKISSSNLRKYKQKEGAELVVNDLKDDKRVLQLPLVKENGHIRHDSKLVLNAFKKAIEPREKLFIFDLDDTLISTSPHVKEFLSRNFENLYLYKEAEKLIGQLSKGKCILLTYDENGLQKDKINLLNLKNFFSKIYIVKKVQEKHDVLQKLKDKYSDRDIIVVGDRHDAELASAKKLGLKTVCVALKENHNTDAKLHYLYDFVVETGEHFLELTKMV